MRTPTADEMGRWTLDEVEASIRAGRIGPTHQIRHVDWPLFRPLGETSFLAKTAEADAPAAPGEGLRGVAPVAAGRRRRERIVVIVGAVISLAAGAYWMNERGWRVGPAAVPGLQVYGAHNLVIWEITEPGAHGAERLSVGSSNRVGLYAGAPLPGGERDVIITAEKAFTLELRRAGVERRRFDVPKGWTRIRF